jgi:outer membrane protein OmpA-like peptidoglycan-associated protein
MIDKATNQKLDYVYHPDIQNGNYLVILPPNKNYDMIIESEGFLPYTLNIDVPNQTEFYELYQKIYLKTLRQFDVIVGQQVEVKNAFYNAHEDQVDDFRRAHEAALIESDSIDVYELMGDLIEAGDQAGIDYILSLILMANPIDNVDFDVKENPEMQLATRMYYYDESDESKFEKKTVDNQVIYSLPTMYVTRLAEEQKNSVKDQPGDQVTDLENKKIIVLFEAGKSELGEEYLSELDLMLDDLKAQAQLGVEISGYASPEGDEEFNRQLSNERAISVLNYLNHRGLVRRRIIARGYGETVADGISKEESRRVEVRLVNLSQNNR